MATETVQEYQNGMLVNEYTVPIPDEVAHQRTILDAARTALTANRAFVASTPTAAQVSAQVKALTRQVNALIRLQLHDLSGTD